MTLWAMKGGVALFFAIVVMQGAMSFPTIESLEVVNVVTYGGVQAAQFPLSTYNGWLRNALTYVGADSVRRLLPDLAGGRTRGPFGNTGVVQRTRTARRVHIPRNLVYRVAVWSPPLHFNRKLTARAKAARRTAGP